MDNSTYFGLNLVTGSDKVNPLTVDRPNYEKIDEQMHNNQVASIAEATELKSGTTHAITCLTEGAVFFRFTATSDFAAGDTFTFNGTPVSAVLPDGSGLQQGAFKINGTVLCSVVGTLLTVYSFTASGIAADSEKLGGQLPAYYAKATDAISTYVHSRIGTVNNFVGTGANGKVKFAANIQPGDTVQINGQRVTAFAGVEDFVSTYASQNLVGKTLFFLYDSGSQTVNFNSAGSVNLAPAFKMVFSGGSYGTWSGTYEANLIGGFLDTENAKLVSNQTAYTPIEISIKKGKYLVFASLFTNIINQEKMSGSAIRLKNSREEVLYQYTENDKVYCSACTAQIVELAEDVYKPEIYRVYSTSCYASILLVKIG